LDDVISNAHNIVAKGRLAPGEMVVADLENGEFLNNSAVSKMVATKKPYKQWLKGQLRRLRDLGESTFIKEATMDNATLLKLQVCGNIPHLI
jgi:glutamate synthase (ferredoxin)